MSKCRRGIGLVELMVAMGIFSMISVILFALFNRGTEAINLANARQQAELSLNKVQFWLERDLAQVRPSEVRFKRVPIAGNGDALWFLSANDPSDDNLDSSYQREPFTGSPVPQTNILYYLIRPANYSEVSEGFPAGIDPDPSNDFYAPHKFLIRKVIDRTPALDTPETLLTSAEVDTYITAPSDYELTALNAEANVSQARIVADKMLSFEVTLDQSVIEIRTSALRIDEARKKVPIGNVSLKNHPLTTYRLARFLLRK